jgi:hypothetical protein
MTGEDANEFEGDYRGTNKFADLAVQVRNDRTLDTKLVVEVGFSEDYERCYGLVRRNEICFPLRTR